MRRAVLLVVLALPLTVGSGAARPAEKAPFDQPTRAEDGSSRVLLSEYYGESTTISGSVDFERDVGILNWTFSGDSIGGKVVYTRDLMYHEVREGRWLVWGRCDLAGSVLSHALFVPSSSSSPTELLRYLVRTGNFEKLGGGTERGADVTRYHVTLDVERMSQEVPRSARKDTAESLRFTWPESEHDGIPLDVSTDSDGRLRRLNIKWRGDGDGTDGDGLIDTTIELFDYGVDVNAKAPPTTDEIVPRGDPYRCRGKRSD